jgi:hypothetical protein
MKKSSWIHVAIAATLIIAGGAVIALAETSTFNLEIDNDSMVTVDLDGVVEVLTLDDLADGEIRTFDSAEHQITVRRDGDQLIVEMDGEAIGGGALDLAHAHAHKVIMMTAEGDEAHADHKMVFVTGDHAVDGEIHDIQVQVSTDEDFVWNAEDGEKIVVKTVGGHHPIFLHGGHPGSSDLVLYRCEDTGSTLMVDAERATAESYIDPATGCEMFKVDAEHSVIVKTIEIKDED